MPKDPTNKLPTKIRIMLWLTITTFIASCVAITITITDGNPYAFCAFIITGFSSLVTCHYAEMVPNPQSHPGRQTVAKISGTT